MTREAAPVFEWRPRGRRGLVKTIRVAALSLTLALAPLAARADVPGDYEMYGRAIAWLAKQQQENGAFGQIPGQPPGEVGITGLVIKALASAPEPFRAQYRPAAEKAAAWVLKHQQADGSFSMERSGLTTYRTSISIMALVALDKEKYAAQIQKASAWLTGNQWQDSNGVKEQDPYHGGFGYDKAGEKPDADLSNTHMALAALKEAGIGPDDPVWKRAMKFVSRCQNSSETNPAVGGLKPLDDGGFIYDPGLDRNKAAAIDNGDGTHSFNSYASMTYAGLLALLHAGLTPEDPKVKSALGWIKDNYTLEENAGLGLRQSDPKAAQQGLYYYYHSFAKCLAARGAPTVETKDGEKRWAVDLFQALRAREKGQDQGGGMWSNDSDRWMEKDPTLVGAYVVNAMNYAVPFLPEGSFAPLKKQ